MNKKKFNDDFDEMVYNLSKIFKMKDSVIPFSKIQSRLYQLLREDRYNILTYHDDPRFAVVDIRVMERIRELLITMGYLDSEKNKDKIGVNTNSNDDFFGTLLEPDSK